MVFIAYGLNHKTAPLEMREKFALSSARHDVLLSQLLDTAMAEEAANFYISVFSGSAFAGKNSKIKNVTTLHNTPSGDSEIVSFELSGQSFMAISAGPYFTFNPSISLQFYINQFSQVHLSHLLCSSYCFV